MAAVSDAGIVVAPAPYPYAIAYPYAAPSVVVLQRQLPDGGAKENEVEDGKVLQSDVYKLYPYR